MHVRVLIVEDQKMVRNLFEIYVNSVSRYKLVTSISNADLALQICKNTAVDLILMDVMTELGHSGLSAAEQIKKQFPNIKIIIVTSMPEYSWISKAREIGVDSFWYKDTSKETILDVMEKTVNGIHVYPDETPVTRIGQATNHEFTERELVILKELLTGDSNREIGERLFVAPSTVKFHIQNLLEKTGFKTRTELATEARSLGIVIRENTTKFN